MRKPRALKTHCKWGHPYTGDNIYYAPSGERYCRECSRLNGIKTYEKAKENPDLLRKRAREAMARFRKTEKGKEAGRRLTYNHRRNNPEKHKARTRVYDAIRRGHMEKPSICSTEDYSCSGRIEGHHPDYSKPLGVVWLCWKHHRELHKNVISSFTTKLKVSK